jgi:hypothetical protein
MSKEIRSVGTEGVKIEDAIDLIAQKVVTLKLLSKSKEEEEEERIDPVMRSFFDIDEGESEEKDSAGTILATEDITLLPVVATIQSPKVDLAAIVVTPSAIVVVEEKIGSSNPAIAEDKGKGLQ